MSVRRIARQQRVDASIGGRVPQPIRVLHLVSHPIPYFAPLYRLLSQNPDIDLTVGFYSDLGTIDRPAPGFGVMVDWDVPTLEGFRYLLIGGEPLDERPRGLPLRRLGPIVRLLRSNAYDVVWLHGYASTGAAALVGAAQALRIPVLIRDEAHLLDARGFLRRSVKRALLPVLFRRARCMYIGSASRAFFRSFGVPDDRLTFTPYSVDNDFFRTPLGAHRTDQRYLRTQLGLWPDLPVILFCGRLVEKKDPVGLLRAFLASGVDMALVFAGDGPLRHELERLAAANPWAHIKIMGFMNQTQLPSMYAASDVLVLPSLYSETWGLVVNEAMNLGLPIIVSTRVGSAHDLVRDGRNGYVVDPGNLNQLSEAIRELADPQRRQSLGEESLRLISEWGIPQTARGIRDACCASMHRPVSVA